MKQIVVGAILGAVLGFGGSMVAIHRIEVRYDSSIATLEQHDALHLSAISVDRERLEHLETFETSTVERLAVVERVAITRAVAVRPSAPVAFTRPVERSAANWWCYFGRECFRTIGECSQADPGRQAECKSARAAWCGGSDGKECFANAQDCFDAWSKHTTFNGAIVPADNDRNCVLVE